MKLCVAYCEHCGGTNVTAEAAVMYVGGKLEIIDKPFGWFCADCEQYTPHVRIEERK